ncbi:MAG TPA: HAMP domain-containing sensor histidine kinase [Oculatellaceae cyanobacterium]
MQLSIKNKIVIFLLLPLFVEVIFSLLLYALNESLEQYASAEHAQRQVVEHLNYLSTLLGNSLSTVFYRGNENPLTARSDRLDDLTNEFSKLKELTTTNPELSKQVAELEPFFDQQFKTLLYLHSLPTKSLTESDLQSDAFRNLMRTFSTTTARLNIVLRQQQLILDAKEKEERIAQQQIKVLVIVGIVCNGVIASVIVLAFVTDLRRRLSILIDNADHMSEGREFNAVAGQDELSFLNRVLEMTSTKLLESQRSRQHVMQMITHDLRSPLTALQINIDTLLYRSPETFSDKTHNRLKKMKGFIGKTIALTEDLLLLEKLEAGALELNTSLIDIQSLVGECIDGIQDLAEQKNMKVLNECRSSTISVDEKRIAQVVTNLLTNAIKVSPAGSQVSVETQISPKDLRVLVVDSGPGLSKFQQEKIFSRFYQAGNSSAGGFGVGLAIVRSLIEAHGGSVGIESTQGKGSQFWFTIPFTRP